ncbi:MAG: lipoate--protein ligase [Bacilli bacterium]|nr:lipoate--protein ligase [Bacilli bacterium]
MKSLNLQVYGKQDISFFLAIEKYLLARFEKDLFFLWDLYPAVICGKNQLIETEVNLKYTKENKIKVFRRHTGGGAVYADEGCFMFTFLTKNRNKDQVFKKYLAIIQRALEKLGLEVVFSGRNDLLFQGKKFSGNAFMSTEYGSILHGTIMYDTNIEKMVFSLTPDDDKLRSKGISSVRQRVINLKEYLDFDIYGLMNHIYNYISSEEETLSGEDYQKIKEIEKSYLTKEWLNNQNPPYTFRNKQRFTWGSLEVMIDVRKGKIKNINFNGDFFSNKNLSDLRKYFVNQEYSEESFENILKGLDLGDYLIGANNKDLIDLVWR